MNTDTNGTDSDETIVRAMLHVAGLTPSEDEVLQLVAAYADHRLAVDRLYAVVMPKEERPQPVFGFELEVDGSDDE